MSGPRDAGESLFCRPALVHTFHVALYLLFAPLSSSTFIHPPAFHLPFASLAPDSFARSRAHRPPASQWIYRFELPREKQTAIRPRTVYVVCLFHILRSIQILLHSPSISFSFPGPDVMNTIYAGFVDLYCLRSDCRLLLPLLTSCQFSCAGFFLKIIYTLSQLMP